MVEVEKQLTGTVRKYESSISGTIASRPGGSGFNGRDIQLCARLMWTAKAIGGMGRFPVPIEEVDFMKEGDR